MLKRTILLIILLGLASLACTGLFPWESNPPAPVDPVHPPDSGPEATPVPADENSFKSYHQIESVDVLLMESAPPQVNLWVQGYQPDGCEFPVEVTQQRQGNTVVVEIFRIMPLAAACPMMIVDYEDIIKLDGTFETGQTYTIRVNDYETTITP